MKRSARPETAASGVASNYYADSRVDHYHSNSNVVLQAELARCALDLTGADERANDLLLDLGCGSGLSAKVAVAKKDRFVVGGDVASDMLGKIDRKSMGRVDLVQFDFAQRWPFRNVGSTAVSSSGCQEEKSSGIRPSRKETN